MKINSISSVSVNRNQDSRKIPNFTGIAPFKVFLNGSKEASTDVSLIKKAFRLLEEALYNLSA